MPVSLYFGNTPDKVATNAGQSGLHINIRKTQLRTAVQQVRYTTGAIIWRSNDHVIGPVPVNINTATNPPCKGAAATKHREPRRTSCKRRQIQSDQCGDIGIAQNYVCLGRITSNYKIVITILIKIPGAAHRIAEMIRPRSTGDAEALVTGEGCQVDVREGGGGAVTEDHVRRPGVNNTIIYRADCNIIVTVAVNITCTAYTVSALVRSGGTEYAETRCASAPGGQIDRSKCCAVPKHDIGCSSSCSAKGACLVTSNDEVIGTVAVHIPHPAYSLAQLITSSSAPDPEARSARGEGGQIYVRPAAGLAKDHHYRSRVSTRRRVIAKSAHRKVVYTILIEISCAADGGSPVITSVCTQYFDATGKFHGSRVYGAC
jgi:hypothetical protein